MMTYEEYLKAVQAEADGVGCGHDHSHGHRHSAEKSVVSVKPDYLCGLITDSAEGTEPVLKFIKTRAPDYVDDPSTWVHPEKKSS